MSAKNKNKGGNTFSIRTVKNKEDRKRPSVFIRLKSEEAFKGIALFEPDPELEDNPFYFEYFSHYDKQANQYVPCSGAKCPFCAANDNPSTRALTVWFFPEAANEADKIKVFEFNYTTTSDLIDEAEEEEGILGKPVRVKRLNDGGDYRISVKGKAIPKKELDKALKAAGVKFADGLVALVERQLKAQMERLKALDALDDDDDDSDDDEDEKTTAKKGNKKDSKKKKEAEKDDSDDDDDDSDDSDDDSDDDEEDSDDSDDDSDDEGDAPEAIEEEEFELLSVSKKKNTVKVEHDGEEIELVGDEDDEDADVSGFKKGDTVTISAEWDEEDEQWNITSISDESDSDDGDDESDDDEEDSDDDESDSDDESDDDDESISGGTYEVVKVQAKDEIFDLKGEDGKKVKMWVGDGVKIDYDEVKKGVKITVDASPDDEGDLIITSFELAKGKKSGKKK